MTAGASITLVNREALLKGFAPERKAHMARRKRMESSDNNKPAAEFRINGLKAVVWENETKNGSMYNTTLVRVYKDKNDEWQETNSLSRDDLLAARKVLDEAHSFILDEERNARSTD